MLYKAPILQKRTPLKLYDFFGMCVMFDAVIRKPTQTRGPPRTTMTLHKTKRFGSPPFFKHILSATAISYIITLFNNIILNVVVFVFLIFFQNIYVTVCVFNFVFEKC